MSIDAASGASGHGSLLDASNAAQAARDVARTGGPSGTKASGDTQKNKDTFMKLLVAQLRYQDPSKPVDSSTFIAQTAQFSSLETLEGMSKNNTSMLAAQLRLQASSLVGQSVSYPGADGIVTGTVTSASFAGTGEPVLKVDGKEIALSKVVSVDAPTSTTPPAA
ncbi:flagellar basal-body rod modification protein FlgD [Kineococcus xinjiangensis]|uniref:Flagellar basal-body rod modification protein FlgD n=1 Tax=Kineococcus xinjiangensis TaxID=512762 RepID=A0A2S6IJY9_9ACTN|nr:flagellar hook capping FlgD N-terminal domain-containing protein [Kineococcus xinjiangensis]PPK94518.1 flagellar basal-body rod modification protein FlgD [Kineococcus xinjiangensis]